jgi:hypothetical protein
VEAADRAHRDQLLSTLREAGVQLILIPAAWTDDSPVNWSGSAGCDSQSPL